MTTRNSRPQLQPPDLSPPARHSSSAPPRIAADDPRFAAAADLETHDAYLRGVQEGRVRVVNPDTVPSRPDERAQPPAKRRSPETSLSTKVPQSVLQQLRRRYAETGVTHERRSGARGGAVGPRGQSAHGHSCSCCFAGDNTSTQRWTFAGQRLPLVPLDREKRPEL